MDFETALRAQIEVSASRRRRARRVLEILDSRPSRRRTRQLARMERHALAALDSDAKIGAIDWSAIDWAKVFEKILEVLLKLLPLLLVI